jgi:hypothetical protein
MKEIRWPTPPESLFGLFNDKRDGLIETAIKLSPSHSEVSLELEGQVGLSRMKRQNVIM